VNRRELAWNRGMKNRGAITKEHGDEEQWQRDAQEW